MMIDTVVLILDFDSRQEDCEKAKTSVQNYITKFSIDLN